LSNILLSEYMEVKVADFSKSVHLSKQTNRANLICGSMEIMAPEMLANKFGYSYEVDVWALGIITYTLLVGHNPFRDPIEIKEKIMSGDW